MLLLSPDLQLEPLHRELRPWQILLSADPLCHLAAGCCGDADHLDLSSSLTGKLNEVFGCSLEQIFVCLKKLQVIKNCDFAHFQSYFNDKSIENDRMKFKIRSKMLETIPGNFKTKIKTLKIASSAFFLKMR